MSDMNRDRIRLGPWPLPLTEAQENALALFKAELREAGRTFLEITDKRPDGTPDRYTMVVPVNQPVIAPAPAAVEGR